MCTFYITYNCSHQHKKLLERGSKIHEKTGACIIYISCINTIIRRVYTRCLEEKLNEQEKQMRTTAKKNGKIQMNWSSSTQPWQGHTRIPTAVGERYTPRALEDVICGTMFVRGHALVSISDGIEAFFLSKGSLVATSEPPKKKMDNGYIDEITIHC